MPIRSSPVPAKNVEAADSGLVIITDQGKYTVLWEDCSFKLKVSNHSSVIATLSMPRRAEDKQNRRACGPAVWRFEVSGKDQSPKAPTSSSCSTFFAVGAIEPRGTKPPSGFGSPSTCWR